MRKISAVDVKKVGRINKPRSKSGAYSINYVLFHEQHLLGGIVSTCGKTVDINAAAELFAALVTSLKYDAMMPAAPGFIQQAAHLLPF